MARTDDWLHYLLLEWGEWYARSVFGLGFSGASIEARCMEYGTDGASASGHSGPIVPYYWPNHRVRRVHGQILALSDVDRGALVVRYVDQVGKERAAEVLGVSARAYCYRLAAAKERLRAALGRPSRKVVEVVED